MSEDLRYPIGRFTRPETVDPESLASAIDRIAAAPAALRRALRDLDEARLDTPYRPGGWSVRQVAHHMADSHMNAYVRTRLALTEENPTIRPYDEAAWARLPDTAQVPVGVSLSLLDALHERWVATLRGVAGAAFERPVTHPEYGPFTLAQLTAMYAWHGEHHVAHITRLRERESW